MTGFLSVRCAARRSPAALLSVILTAFLSACADRDVTRMVPTPSAADASEARPRGLVIERPPDARHWPDALPSAPAEDTRPEPLGPMPVDGDGPAGAESSEPAPVDCSAITPVPASYELLEGFASSEDFVFDELGNYVGIDDDNNLVRISRDRKRTLWLPDIGSLAGMGILPDGSVVFCEVEEGALKRVYPNGAVSVVLGGLLYPNGLDIGPDGFVYVAENNGGRVRRIDPDTGEFTIVAMGLFDPNGVAFSDDPTRLYVGSFSGSGVYEVELSNPGELGRARVFARPPGARLRRPLLACPQQVEGMDCVTPYYSRAQCQAIANVVDCLPVDPCPELEEGDFCDYPETGICREQRCDPLPSCRELGEGAACETPAGPGVCQFSDGYPFCGPPNPCAGLAPGAACEDSFFGPGTCEALDDLVYCVPLDPCEGREAGDACDDPFFGRGVCRAFDETFIFCDSLNPCEGLEDGARCEYFGFGEGVCTNAQCLLPNVCAGLPAGTPCDDPNGSSGVCQPSGDENYCLPPSSCGSLQLGDPCENLGTFGVCQSADGYLFCGEVNACDGLRAGDACDHPQTGPGVCFDDQGTLVCAPHNVCLELAPGEACEDPLWGSGVCEQGVCGGLLANGGGIDGLGVDACGNVYATEYIYGKIWRMSPAGEMELLAELPSSWIPNIKWGRGLGGFASDVMYVADREAGRLFGLYVGVPGATEFHAGGAK